MRFILMTMCVLALAGCSTVDEAHYAKLKSGMSSAEVEAVLGSADKCDETLGFRSCQWGNEEHFIKVKYIGDKAISLSKHGLN